MRPLAYPLLLALAFIPVNVTAASVPPTNVKATDYTSLDKITITWAPGDASQYFQVWRAEGYNITQIPTPQFVAVSSWITGNSFDDVTAIPGKYYLYQVKAGTNSNGDDASDLAGQTRGVRALQPPTNLQATDGTSSEFVEVSWTEPQHPAGVAVRYLIYEGYLADESDMTLGSIISAGPYQDIMADVNRKKYYRVRTIPDGFIEGTDVNNLSLSNIDDGWRTIPIPKLYVSQTGTLTNVAWTNLGIYYRLFLGTTTDINDAKPLLGWGKYSGVPTKRSLQNGVDYYYFLKSALSPADSATVGKFAISEPTNSFRPLDPTAVTASYGTEFGKITIEWEAVAGAGGYKVYRSTTSNFEDATPVSDWLNQTSFEDVRDPETETGEYYYWVKAATVGSDNTNPTHTSLNLYPAKGKISPPKQPNNFAVNVSTFGNEIRLSWDVESPDLKFKVYRNTVQNILTATPLTDWSDPGAAGAYTDVTAGIGITYYYFVKASYPEVLTNDKYSRIAISKEIFVPIPRFPISASIDLSTRYIKISWGSVTGAAYFVVYRSSTGEANSFFPITDLVEGISYNDTTTIAGKFYRYGVIAVSADLSSSTLSSNGADGLKKLDRPKVVVEKIPNGNKVTWSYVPGANNYQIYRSLNPTDTAGANVQLLRDWNLALAYVDENTKGQLWYYSVVASTNSRGDHTSFFSKPLSSYGSGSITGLGDDVITLSSYPNPTTGKVVLNAPGAITELDIIDMKGRSIKTPVNDNHADISSLPAGLYVFRGTYGTQRFAVKVIKVD